MFVTDCWYVAAWSDDVGRDPVPRTMLNRPLVPFRTRDGAPVALEDRCVHRHLPLSQGSVVGDTIRRMTPASSGFNRFNQGDADG